MVARKRHIRSHLKGSKRSKKMTSGSSRKFRTGRTRLRPEVKYAPIFQAGQQITCQSAATSTLLAANWVKAIDFPAQGTSDITRIGDTIMGKKLYLRISLFTSAAQLSTTNLYRILVFNLKTFQTAATDIPGFWQNTCNRTALNAIVNREVVNKVFYDKQFVIKAPFSGGYCGLNKAINLNINMRWPVIFPGGLTVPKDPRNIIYIGVAGFNYTAAENAALGFMDFKSNFYYTDS